MSCTKQGFFAYYARILWFLFFFLCIFILSCISACIVFIMDDVWPKKVFFWPTLGYINYRLHFDRVKQISSTNYLWNFDAGKIFVFPIFQTNSCGLKNFKIIVNGYSGIFKLHYWFPCSDFEIVTEILNGLPVQISRENRTDQCDL